MNIVIIGNSAAAIGAVEAIREENKDAFITIISDEAEHTYGRPLISYLLCGKTDEERMRYRPADFYEKNNVRTLLGRRVQRIDAQKKQVVTEDGTPVAYDKLLIAAGSRPFVPPICGLDSVPYFTFMDKKSAKALGDACAKDKNVLILGAGLIGLKCAEGIADRVAHITVCDLAPHILPSILNEAGAKLVQQHIERRNIDFVLGEATAEIRPGCAVTKSGREIPFDLLVVATGVRPNVELAREAGCAVDRGILIDEHCKTSVEDIYAAGDCSQGEDILHHERRILALMGNANLQGGTAGRAMIGLPAAYPKSFAQNAIGFFGLHLVTAGCYDGQEIAVPTESGMKILYVRDNHLVGFIIIGDVAKSGIYTALIREQTPLDSIDFELICQKPQLMAFSRTDRAKKLSMPQE